MQAIDNCYIAANAVVLGDVVLADGANIWYGCVVRGDLARITLGPRANLQDGCIVHADYELPQTIDEGVVAGHAAVLHGSHIGRDTLIGIGARLLTKCDVGEECIIAAGAVVTKDVPAHALVYGSPATIRGWRCKCGLGLEFEGGLYSTASCLDCGSSLAECDVRAVGQGDLEY